MKIYTQGRKTLKLKLESRRIRFASWETHLFKHKVDGTQTLVLCMGGGRQMGRICGHLCNYFGSFSTSRNNSSSISTDDDDFYDAAYDYDK